MEPAQPLDRIVLLDTKSAALSVELVARIDEQGDLVLEGWDRGAWVKEQFDDYDHEYWLKIPQAWKDTILLYLLQERFENVSTLKEWLQNKQIPFEFSSYT